MQDILTMLSELRRPRLLIRAARFGAEEYKREAHLPRLLGGGRAKSAGQAIMQLLDIERQLEEKRRANDGNYRVARHVSVLIAIMGEARALREAASL